MAPENSDANAGRARGSDDPIEAAIAEGRKSSAGTGMETTDGLGTGAGTPGVADVRLTRSPDVPTRTPTIRTVPEREATGPSGDS